MHIRKFILLIPILLLILVGCSSTKTIDPPSDFRYEAGFLYWDEIEGADHYVVEINNQTKMAYNNKLDLKDFITGNYTARIASFSNGNLSDYTDYITFQLIHPESIEDIIITDEVIAWDKHSNLTYEVSTYSDQTKLTTISPKSTNSQFDYSHLPDGSYMFTINAYLEDTLVTTSEIRIIKDDFRYVRDAGLVLDLEIPTEIYLEDTLLVEDEDYILDDFGIILNSSVIDELEGSGISLKLVYDHPVYIYLNIVTIEEPMIISSNGAIYEGEDLSFDFDLKGGTFMGLGGNNVDELDYVFDEETLTIKSDYIDEIISNDPNRTMLILTYVLQNDPHIVIGYIFISIPNQSVLD